MFPVLLCVTHSLKAQAHGNKVTLIFFGLVAFPPMPPTSVTAEQVSRFPASASRLLGCWSWLPCPHPLLASPGLTEAPWFGPPNPQTHSCMARRRLGALGQGRRAWPTRPSPSLALLDGLLARCRGPPWLAHPWPGRTCRLLPAQGPRVGTRLWVPGPCCYSVCPRVIVLQG